MIISEIQNMYGRTEKNAPYFLQGAKTLCQWPHCVWAPSVRLTTKSFGQIIWKLKWRSEGKLLFFFFLSVKNVEYEFHKADAHQTVSHKILQAAAWMRAFRPRTLRCCSPSCPCCSLTLSWQEQRLLHQVPFVCQLKKSGTLLTAVLFSTSYRALRMKTHDILLN